MIKTGLRKDRWASLKAMRRKVIRRMELWAESKRYFELKRWEDIPKQKDNNRRHNAVILGKHLDVLMKKFKDKTDEYIEMFPEVKMRDNWVPDKEEIYNLVCEEIDRKDAIEKQNKAINEWSQFNGGSIDE